MSDTEGDTPRRIHPRATHRPRPRRRPRTRQSSPRPRRHQPLLRRSRHSPWRSPRCSPLSPSRPAGRRRRACARPATRRYPTQTPSYGPPRAQAYAGQPAAAPQYASAFGQAGRPDANQTQPTVPFDRNATGTVVDRDRAEEEVGRGQGRRPHRRRRHRRRCRRPRRRLRRREPVRARPARARQPVRRPSR